MYGGVTDFIEVRLGTYYWPAFNAADSAISIGAALVLIEILFFGGRQDVESAESKRN
jgi:signal peptidase II